MKTILALLSGCLLHTAFALAPSDTLPIIPRVTEWHPDADGRRIVVRTINLRAEGSEASRVTDPLAEDWRRAFGWESIRKTGTVVLLRNVSAPSLEDEGYRLSISTNGIEIAANNRIGLWWGTRSLLQLARAGKDIPCGTIVDYPDFKERGAVLDVARRFVPMTFLRDIVRELAYYKMNTLHIHLNDDRVADDLSYYAFRLESNVPGLTSRDGSYSKEEFRAFVKEAAEQGVNIIPEIDSPGHSLAFIRVRPKLALPRGWDQLNVNDPEALSFVKSIWSEYLDGMDPVFAGPDVHVGTDEFFRGSSEAYRAYTDSLFRFVQGKGKRVHAWGAFSSCTGRTDVVSSRDITIDLWHYESYIPHQALDDGYSVCNAAGSFLYIVPGSYYYQDFPNIERVIREWSPKIGDGGHPILGEPPVLRGGKFALWNDHIKNGITQDDIFERFYPLMRAVAEKTWSSEASDWESYQRRAASVGEAPGLDYLDARQREAIGWSRDGGWTVKFRLCPSGMEETLFNDGFSSVKLFPGGRLGFSRDGYDVLFDFAFKPGTWYDVVMTGTKRSTALTVNGTLVKDFQPENRSYPGGKRWTYRHYRTLHFPLHVPVGRTSKVTNFSCANGISRTDSVSSR